MAGHSKWANIQHRKNAQDAKRGKLFTKLIREITVAARSGDPDPNANPRLRTAVDKALTANMTRDIIERAIKRGSGAIEGEHYEEVRYEGYGPGGAAVMVDCMTDNRNRTASDVRYAFSKYGGNLGTDGSVAYLFTKLGVLSYPVGSDEDALMEAGLDAGAQDVVSNDDGSVDVLTDPADFNRVNDAMLAAKFVPESAEVTMRASTSAVLDAEAAASMVKMLDVLEDLDDVQQVYSNADISDEILGQL
jgi:YebC/PmpR family DNA-binding regulatory protein